MAASLPEGCPSPPPVAAGSLADWFGQLVSRWHVEGPSVTATGIRILGGVDFKEKRHNLFIVAIAVGFGLIPLIAPNFFKNFPGEMKLLLESGIILASIVSVVLNAFFNGVGSQAQAEADVAAAASHADI